MAVLEGGFTGIGFWYIGLTDLGREGEWMWIHNQADVKDEMWNMNRPNNKSRNSNDCVVMVLRNNLGVSQVTVGVRKHFILFILN